jgi:diguanylate cyclase
MPLEYKSSVGLEAIMPVLDEHVVWYGKLVKSYFEGKIFNESPPDVFQEWLEKARSQKNVSPETADRINLIYEEMVQAAREFAMKYSSRETPPLKEYNEVARYYEEFIQAMRRIELDQAIENSGFDERTGLRSPKLLPSDFEREMERRSRRGNPFALALVKVNNFQDKWRKDDKTLYPLAKRIANKIKESVRSFDDAYHLGDEYFLLFLKHADMLGSQAAMGRVNQAITGAHIPTPGDLMTEISISSVLCEPTKGDLLENLIKNLKKDLEGIDSKGTVLQYQDLSPLQRYMHSIIKEK